jgi:uncharacterized protein YtpQ (UPF0354 family)
MVIADGNYEATLILADAVLAKLPKVDGELVVAIPARDVFVFTGSNNAVGVAALRKVAADLSEQAAHALTPALLVRRGGKFEVL